LIESVLDFRLRLQQETGKPCGCRRLAGRLLQFLLAAPRTGNQRKLRPTPAMQAGLVDTLWTIEDLYDAVMQQAERKRKSTRINKLIAKLREQQ
jgi:hypothetical protein